MDLRLATVTLAGCLIGLLTWTTPASSVSPEHLGLDIRSVVSGKEKPAVILRPGLNLRSVTIRLKGDDGSKRTLKSGRIGRGQTKVLSFSQKKGAITWTAQFDVVPKGGEATSFTTTFQTTRVGKLALKIGSGDVDMDARVMRFRITNPAASAELVILGEGGKTLDVVEVPYEGAPAGETLTLSWPDVSGEILRMDLKVTDIAGFWTGMQITPFMIEIPHDEVVFPSGKADIRPEEAPKLERTLTLIQEALVKHGTLLQLKLFVGGYTDTVGGKGYNLDLSKRRARAIAAWFRSHGLNIPVYYQGFGENVLAKPTDDETDEPANRRALYILSSQTPRGAEVPTQNWHRL
jgi:outer membrane protein OmpA-like peptidoglycan-associated protein